MAREEPSFVMHRDSRRGRGSGTGRGKSRRKHPNSSDRQITSKKDNRSNDVQSNKENSRGKEKSYSHRQITSNWSQYDKALGELNLEEDDELTDVQRLKCEDERFQLMLQSSRARMASSRVQFTDMKPQTNVSDLDFFTISYSSLADSIQELPLHVRLRMDRKLLIQADLCDWEEDDTDTKSAQSPDLHDNWIRERVEEPERKSVVEYHPDSDRPLFPHAVVHASNRAMHTPRQRGDTANRVHSRDCREPSGTTEHVMLGAVGSTVPPGSSPLKSKTSVGGGHHHSGDISSDVHHNPSTSEDTRLTGPSEGRPEVANRLELQQPTSQTGVNDGELGEEDLEAMLDELLLM